jgi:hypothetical protein
VSNRITVFDSEGQTVATAEGNKMELAHAILDAVVARRSKGKGKGGRVKGWVGGAR